MRPVTGGAPFPSLQLVKVHSCAKDWHSPIAMKQSRRANDWGALFGSAKAAVTTEVETLLVVAIPAVEGILSGITLLF